MPLNQPNQQAFCLRVYAIICQLKMEDLDESRSKSRSSSPSRTPLSSWWSQTGQVINEIVEDAPVTRMLSKGLVVIYAVSVLWLILQLLSLSGYCTGNRHSTPSQGEEVLHNYFSNFECYAECNIRAVELYSPSPRDERGFYEYGTFCSDRKHLLKALSEGGRIGFDAPYKPRGNVSLASTRALLLTASRLQLSLVPP